MKARRAGGVGARLDRINKTLERQNEIVQAMLDAMPKPKNKAVSTLEIVALVVGVLGVLSSVQIIRVWILGG